MNRFTQFGKQAGAAMLGHSQEDLLRAESSASVMDSPSSEPFDRQIFKIAATAYEVDGASKTTLGLLFEKLASDARWSLGYKPFADCVKRAMAKCDALVTFQANAQAEQAFQKSALLPAVAVLHDQLGGGMLRAGLGLGALAGAGLGSLGFLLSRNARQSSADNAAVMEKIRTYKLLRKEIEEDMEANDVAALATGGKRKGADTRKKYDV